MFETIIGMASIFEINRRTIERWLNYLPKNEVDSIPIMPGRGVKTRLVGYEVEVAKQLEVHNQNFKDVVEYFDIHKSKKLRQKSLNGKKMMF